jgi:3-oxoadipate enol-lactonase
MSTVRLNFEIDGPQDGQPLLLAGSLGTTPAMWEPQVPQLAQDYRVIRVELRGHGGTGGSPVPPGPYSIDDLGGDVLALMDRLGLEHTSYCGLSIGGMVGQWLAINAPHRVRRLILISTSAHLPPADAWHERAAAVRQAGTPEVVADAVLGRWFTPAYAERRPEVVARYREMISSTAAESYAGCCEAIAAMDLRDGLPQITAATLVIVGAQDPATPPVHGAAIAGAVAAARLEVLDPGAHLLSVERAADVTRLIRDHMERTA